MLFAGGRKERKKEKLGKIEKECQAALGIASANIPVTACSPKNVLRDLELVQNLQMEGLLAKKRRIIAKQELAGVIFELMGIKHDILKMGRLHIILLYRGIWK